MGCVVDGCPPGIRISQNDIQTELDRRKPGKNHISSSRKEKDRVHIMSGIFKGETTGAPVIMVVHNKDVKTEDYSHLKNLYRPSHADFTFQKKYGIRDWRGGGRASARETVARVAAGAIAKKYLSEKEDVKFLTYVEQIQAIKGDIDYKKVNLKDIESSVVRCPDRGASQQMEKLLNKTQKEGDTLGGVVFGAIRNMPLGLGEPVFDKLSADLAKAMLSVGATRGFEYGSGFTGSGMKGSDHNDEFYVRGRKIKTRTNNSGGIQGGISNGEDVYFRVAFKPVSSFKKTQKTVDIKGREVSFQAGGRHDACIVPRAVPIIEAMASLVVIDHYLRNKAQNQ